MKVFPILFAGISLLAPFLHAQAPSLRVGAAAVDITPREFPLNMPGGFSANLAEGAHDPLHSRALVLDDGSVRLALAVVDTLGAGPEVLDEIKELVADKTGIPVERMLISSTHTHTGPSHPKEGAAPAVAYRKVFVEGVVASLVAANAALKPARFGSASHPLPDEVFNRRWFLKPGKMPPNPFGKYDAVKMNPGTGPDVIDRPAGPTDPDVSVL
jgi:neutral ceramidase